MYIIFYKYSSSKRKQSSHLHTGVDIIFKRMHANLARLIRMHNKLIILVFKTAVSWMKIQRQQIEQRSRFPGQWCLFNCGVNTNDDVTLWFKRVGKSEEKRRVIDKKIISVSKNIFNITRLTDRGFYICTVCGLEKQIFLEILKGKLILIK